MTKSCQRSGWLLLVGLIAFPGCGPKAETTGTAPRELPTITVTTVPLETRTIQRTVNVVGTLNGYEDLTIAPKVDGRVITIRPDVGDVVWPGMVLLELESVDYELDVEVNRRALAAELARLGLKALPPRGFDPEAVPLVRRAEVALQNAKTEFARMKSLSTRNVSSQREYDASEMEFRLAEASKLDAVTQAEAVLAGARHRQALLELAEQRLSDSRLLAPIPYGWEAWSALIGPAANPLKYSVAAKLISEGEMVRSMPVTNAFRLVIDHALKLRAAVPERYTAEVKVGQAVQIWVDAFPEKVFLGHIIRVNPTVDIATRTFPVEIAVSNLDGKLKAGSFARAAIQTRVDEAVQVVPPAAMISFAGVNKLFIVDAGKAKSVPVEIGTRSGDWVEVRGDLPPDATIITSGLSQIVEGSPVMVKTK